MESRVTSSSLPRRPVNLLSPDGYEIRTANYSWQKGRYDRCRTSSVSRQHSSRFLRTSHCDHDNMTKQKQCSWKRHRTLKCSFIPWPTTCVNIRAALQQTPLCSHEIWKKLFPKIARER